MEPRRYTFLAHETLDRDDAYYEKLEQTRGVARCAPEGAAHDQPGVYEEGRSDNHSEADALVHAQLICGLVS